MFLIKRQTVDLKTWLLSDSVAIVEPFLAHGTLS